MELDSQKMEDALRQMEDLLQEFAKTPVPDYRGFLFRLRDSDFFTLPDSPYFSAAIIAESLNRCEQLITEDERQVNASEEGLQAFLREKLLIRLLRELPQSTLMLIEKFQECFQRGSYQYADYQQGIKDYLDSVVNLVNFDWMGVESSDYKRIENMDTVIAIATRTIALNPETDIAYLWRGGAYFRKGDYDEAIEDCTQVIGLGSERADVYVLRGTARFRKSSSDLKSVMADFNEAVQLLPNHAGIYLARGNIYQEVNDSKRAIEDYDNAVRLCPNYKTDLVDRKHIAAELDMLPSVEKVIELLNSRIGKPYSSPDDYYYLGVRELFKPNTTGAARAFQIARNKKYHDIKKIEEHLKNLLK